MPKVTMIRNHLPLTGCKMCSQTSGKVLSRSGTTCLSGLRLCCQQAIRLRKFPRSRGP